MRGTTWAALAAIALGVSGCSRPALLYEGRGETRSEPIEVRLVTIGEDGLHPSGPIRLVRGEGGIAFANDTRGALVSVVFEEHALSKLRCSYTQGFTSDGRSTWSEEPIAPGGSVSLCFHDAGQLGFAVYGVTREALRGVIEVFDGSEVQR